MEHRTRERIPYRIFEHTADLGVEIYGRSREELFSNAAGAICDIVTEGWDVGTAHERIIEAEGTDGEDLLVNFLREVLYLLNGKGFISRECRVAFTGDERLSAALRGEPLDMKKHRLTREIKAVTYHQVSLKQTGDGWSARVIFDV
ncbi:MAG: archease [Deltaproteobacteria bacterium]|nr:archease [Deltaproteobacteria bacterium]